MQSHFPTVSIKTCKFSLPPSQAKKKQKIACENMCLQIIIFIPFPIIITLKYDKVTKNDGATVSRVDFLIEPLLLAGHKIMLNLQILSIKHENVWKPCKIDNHINIMCWLRLFLSAKYFLSIQNNTFWRQRIGASCI